MKNDLRVNNSIKSSGSCGTHVSPDKFKICVGTGVAVTGIACCDATGS